jgi:hypothetical protein
VVGGHGHDDRIALGVSREPLALSGRATGLGVGRRVGPEDFVVPDRGDLVQIGVAGGAQRDAGGRRFATRAGERAGLELGEGASGVLASTRARSRRSFASTSNK